jgi:hypothetical protein
MLLKLVLGLHNAHPWGTTAQRYSFKAENKKLRL